MAPECQDLEGKLQPGRVDQASKRHLIVWL